MNITKINGNTFKELMNYGYSNLRGNAKIVNDLNVFPIPDGDTGDNMARTLNGGIDAMRDCQTRALGEMAERLSSGMLLSARGNSGVILSQIFYGIATGLRGHNEIDAQGFVGAMAQGVKQAYSSVSEPVEGTMLTVIRETVEGLQSGVIDSFNALFAQVLEQAKQSVQNTPNKLKVLREAGVVDSGGAGLYYIFEGFNKWLHGEKLESVESGEKTAGADLDFSKFNENSVMEFGYCSEVLLQLQRCKTDVDNFDINIIKDYLATIGDSIVAVQTGTIIKVHVHTFTPYKLLEFCQQFGEFLTVKIENMTLQNKDAHIDNRFEFKKEVARKRKDFGVVTVAKGEGIKRMFAEFGADVVIDGGQTNNPSAEDFIDAFNKTNADVIFVLPNNSNIVLTAKQAKEMYKASEVYVVESKSIGDGYSALSMLDLTSGDIEEIIAGMQSQIDGTTTGVITKAVRTTSCNSVEINCNDYIGFVGKQMLVSEPVRVRAVCGLLDKMYNGEQCLVLIYGKDVKENELRLIRDYVANKFTDLEIYEIDGEQDVYDFYLVLG